MKQTKATLDRLETVQAPFSSSQRRWRRDMRTWHTAALYFPRTINMILWCRGHVWQNDLRSCPKCSGISFFTCAYFCCW